MGSTVEEPETITVPLRFGSMLGAVPPPDGAGDETAEGAVVAPPLPHAATVRAPAMQRALSRFRLTIMKDLHREAQAQALGAGRLVCSTASPARFIPPFRVR
jgi:hypothetical protein